MREKMFYTVIKADHKLGGNEYVMGRVSGIQCAVRCKHPGKDILYGHGENEIGEIYPMKTTSRRYKKFARIVEQNYPGLCIFDYKK